MPLASELGISTSDVNLIKTEYPHNINQQAAVMLQLWQHTAGNKATGKIQLPLSVEVMLYLFSCGHFASFMFQPHRICA